MSVTLKPYSVTLQPGWPGVCLQGQFIYTKYVFEDLRDQATWSLEEMEARLPHGLAGMYRRVMTTLCEALQEERPDMLSLLKARLLPILVASSDTLTVDQLVWAVGLNRVEVRCFLLAGLCECMWLAGWLVCACGWLAGLCECMWMSDWLV